jgi:hypothetical protein
MSHLKNLSLNPFSEPQWISRRQKDVLDCLEQGEIQDVRISQKLPVDKIVLYGLRENGLQSGLKLLPDPRKKIEVPIEVILLS